MKPRLATYYSAIESNIDGLALVDELRATVCKVANLCIQNEGKNFQTSWNDFAIDVWKLLLNVSKVSSRDRVALTTINFLTTLSTSMDHNLFAGHLMITQICQDIVIPIVRLRDEDEELFKVNYIEFIKRDMECDIHIMRRTACKFLKGIATNYERQVTNVVSEQIRTLTNYYNSGPFVYWNKMKCALCLAGPIFIKEDHHTDLPKIGTLENFFMTSIVSILKSKDVNKGKRKGGEGCGGHRERGRRTKIIF
ncbi:hypothetical protein L3X38_013707 [Prunus dulcis]|uniref:Exportin-2 central domain-containing protein n=1 Tax=Prunus dulcis TaxID=3755 RepID=A0AAD4WLT6_PRUDU|nr:hypothetical protein L3X38_013707 [Prunus dulcis]